MNVKRTIGLLFVAALTTSAVAQHEHHAMPRVSHAMLSLSSDTDKREITAKLGPLYLPAHTDHTATHQPLPQFLTIPFDGWITAYHPSLVDDAGNKLPGRMLHHVAFWNTRRSDFLCPNKEEHIFGAGGEMNDWPALPGFGYRVHKGDRIRVTTMFHNPTGQDYPSAWLVVRMEYQPETASLKSVYPAWFDVKQCGDSSFPIVTGGMTLNAEIPVNFSGRLLGVGGHMHDYGEQLVLSDETQKQSIAKLDSTLDGEGHIQSMPVVVFLERGGFPLKKGDEVPVQAKYGNPRQANAEGMAIVVGYFLPANDAEMESLARK
ncbi:MAG: hypothetical protein ACXVZI_06330 [Terriglobales bacterium]